jgi:hypothetical protein
MEDKCLEQDGFFEHCIETLNGKTFYLCEENYHFNEQGKCNWINFYVEEEIFGKCKRCFEDYYVTRKDGYCTPEINCETAYKDLGICNKCIDHYYIDFNDGKCKSNLENDDFIYCVKADGVIYNAFMKNI